MLYADGMNLDVTATGQTVTFVVDGREVLTVDLTPVDLIDAIRNAYSGV